MKIDIIAFTTSGCKTATRIKSLLPEHNISLFVKTSSDGMGLEPVEEPLGSWVRKAFERCDAIMFVGATGIAVRAIAPFVNSKYTDPAVVCIDERGMFVVPILSGHVGGGNDLSQRIAEKLGATAFITTATDINKKFAVDSFATESGMYMDDPDTAKEISSRILDGRFIGILSRCPVRGDPPEGLTPSESGEIGIAITDSLDDSPFKRTLHLIPRRYVLGIGCRKDTPVENIRSIVSSVLKDNGLSMLNVRTVASIDLKKNEPGLLEFCRENRIEPVFYTADELNAVRDIGFTCSHFVHVVTGTDNVCERSATIASDNGRMVQRKTCQDGVTVSLVKERFQITFRTG